MEKGVLNDRNRRIYRLFMRGLTYSELSRLFKLSKQSVRSICRNVTERLEILK